MPQKQGTDQRGDVQAIGVGISQNADFVITQLAQIGATGVNPKRHRNVIHFLRRKNFNGVHLPGVEDLSSKRQDRLIFAIARLLGRAPGRIALHQKQLAARRVFT